MKPELSVSVAFGPLFPKVADQIKAQGLIASGQNYREWERCREAILTLKFARLMSEDAARAAFARIIEDMARECRVRPARRA